jgi:hypothetical protein
MYTEPCQGDVGEGFERHPHMLKRPQETFHDSVVVAVSCVMLDQGDCIEQFML